MAEGPSLRTQVSNLRSKDDLEAVFEHADGFLLIDQDDGAFIPELRRAEAALFPDDAPSTLRNLELVTRLDMRVKVFISVCYGHRRSLTISTRRHLMRKVFYQRSNR